MPVETGPTLYLPYSHQYEPGYLAFHLPEFTEYFQQNYTQLPLEKGDAAFFNPALFHGAGTNVSTDVRRMANLLQVSSPFGRAMETVDRVAMCRALFPVLLEKKSAGASEQPPEQRHRRVRRGLRLPDQPRPRPADRRPRTPDASRPGPPGRRRGMDRRKRSSPLWTHRPHAPAPTTAEAHPMPHRAAGHLLDTRR